MSVESDLLTVPTINCGSLTSETKGCSTQEVVHTTYCSTLEGGVKLQYGLNVETFTSAEL